VIPFPTIQIASTAFLPGSFFSEFSALSALSVPFSSVFNAFRTVREQGRWLWTRLRDLALAVACLGLIWFALAWHLMNFNVHY
jgi:hypothetical protein